MSLLQCAGAEGPTGPAGDKGDPGKCCVQSMKYHRCFILLVPVLL